MNRLKKMIKAGILLLVVFTVACKKKDIPKTHDDQNVSCTKKGTVVPMDCVGQYLGIVDEDNNYYYIEEDLTGDFSKYEHGDKICFDYERSAASTADYSNQGINFTPATSIDLTCISKCHCTSNCKPVKEVSVLPSDSVPSQILNIVEMRQEGSSLYLKVAFSGCDADIDPELFVDSDRIRTGPGPGFECVIKEPGLELCQAHFVKEICFDLSELEKKYKNYELFFNTNDGSKSIKIAH